MYVTGLFVCTLHTMHSEYILSELIDFDNFHFAISVALL